MTAITTDQMQDKLVSLDDVFTLLDQTEPVVPELIDGDSSVAFRLQPDWATDIGQRDATEHVDAFMTINGTERPLTKEAMLQAASNFGLSGAYVKKVPAHLIEGLLNYHYGRGMGDTAYSVLSVNGGVSAFTRPTLTPFSTRMLLERVVEGIQARRGADVPIYADYKIENTLKQSNIRLIIPTEERTIVGGGMDDVQDDNDVWYAGVALANSLVGKTQTSLETYLFRWWCTNGCTTEAPGVGIWSRRVNGQQDDVYDWAREQVDEVLGGLEARFDQVQALTRLKTGGNSADILQQIYADWKVPAQLRGAITDRLVPIPELSMYSIMNAITEAANDSDLSDSRRDTLLRLGGSIPTQTFSSIKAAVWAEGHEADDTAQNPYVISEAA